MRDISFVHALQASTTDTQTLPLTINSWVKNFKSATVTRRIFVVQLNNLLTQASEMKVLTWKLQFHWRTTIVHANPMQRKDRQRLCMQTPCKERISHKRIQSFKQNNVILAKPKYVKSDNSQIHSHSNKGGQITALKVLKKYSFGSDIFGGDLKQEWLLAF